MPDIETVRQGRAKIEEARIALHAVKISSAEDLTKEPYLKAKAAWDQAVADFRTHCMPPNGILNPQ